MTPVQKAVSHILSELRRCGVESTDEVREFVANSVKERLVMTELEVWRESLKQFGKKPKPPYTVKDISVYQNGAFNIRLYTPGGPIEVDDKGKPLDWQKPMHCEVCIADGTKHSISMCSAKAAKRDQT